MVQSVNTMTGSPAMGWPHGETPRQFQQRLLAARRERESTPVAEHLAKPAESPADAYRQEAAKIVAEFGERGREYVAAQMTYGEALAAEHKKLSAENAELAAEADSRERKAKGFAGRFKVGRNGFNAFGRHAQRAE